LADDQDLTDILAEIETLERQVRDSEGAHLAARLGAVARMYRVFLGNHRELVGLLRGAAEPEAAIRLWDVQNRDQFDSFLEEVDRLLHNYLSSAMALVDHTRRLVSKEGGPPAFLSGYEDARKRLFGTPVAFFVQGLRNLTLHRELPVVQGQLSWAREQPLRTRVLLERSHLLEWDGWAKDAREVIASSESDMDLLPILEEYSQAVMRFHDWFGFHWVLERLKPFKDLERRHRRLAMLYRRAGWGED
jgi:hypothetical protein